LKVRELLISPDKNRRPFFDGMEYQDASFIFTCSTCNTNNVINLWSFLDKSESWQRILEANEKREIIKILEIPINSGHIKSHEGGQPYYSICSCFNCQDRYLVYIGFYEFQPTRYFGTLQGIYRVTS
jgi:hypothetical protein